MTREIFRCECNAFKLWYQEHCFKCMKIKIDKIEELDKNE